MPPAQDPETRSAEGQALGKGVKRCRGEEDTGSTEGFKRQSLLEKEVHAVAGGGKPLDVCIGDGPVWRLKEACESSAAARKGPNPGAAEHLVRMARAQLDQALSCDRTTDMRFELDDGAAVGGHKSVLSIASQGLTTMFESGLREDREGVARMPGVKSSAVKGLLEWVYLGHAGENCVEADGRELWMLAEMYNVPGVRKWLVEESINAENFCAACEFCLLLEGETEGDRNDLFRECIDCAKQPETYDMEFNNDGLVGVGYKTMDWLLGAAMNYDKECTSAVMIERGFNFLDKWWAANGGEPGCERGEEVDGLVALLGDLTCLPLRFLKNNVRPSGLVSAERMNEIYEDRIHSVEGKLNQALVASDTLTKTVVLLCEQKSQAANQCITTQQKLGAREKELDACQKVLASERQKLASQQQQITGMTATVELYRKRCPILKLYDSGSPTSPSYSPRSYSPTSPRPTYSPRSYSPN